MDEHNPKLEETFNLPSSEEELMKELEDKYSFTSNPDLNEVAKLALTAYKEQMLDIMHFEPKYRSRALEVAQQYLNLAKDALAKDQDIMIKKGKLEPKGEEESEGGIDRNELMLHVVQGSKK